MYNFKYELVRIEQAIFSCIFRQTILYYKLVCDSNEFLFIQIIKCSDLVNKITAANLTQADIFSYVGRNYDITVGAGAYLTGIGGVGYGYFYNRYSGVYDIQHYSCLGDGHAYERILTNDQDRTWIKLMSASDLPFKQISGSTEYLSSGRYGFYTDPADGKKYIVVFDGNGVWGMFQATK